MTFWEHFLRLLPYKPTHALAALYWHITRRRVRARNRLRGASVDLPFTYDVWIDTVEKTLAAPTDVRQAIDSWRKRPLFSVVLHSGGIDLPEQKKQSITSVQLQSYPEWELVESPAGVVEASLHAAGDYIVPLRVGDSLSPSALFRIGETLQSNPNTAILYGDEDRINARGRRSSPWFKPRWNPELFLALDYLSSCVAIETSLVRKVAKDARNLAELLLAATSQAEGPIVHVPNILLHVRSAKDDENERLEAVSRHLESAGATCAEGPFGSIKVEWPLPTELPLVSIIIPTKDRLDLLRPCLESLFQKTDYPNFEILVLDNESVEEKTAKFLANLAKDPRVQVIRFPGVYNFSSFNNFGAKQVRGSYLCLLNNDTEVVEPAWLSEMMRYAVRPEVGAVGAKLLYDDGTIQHAGVVIGLGEAAGHAHRNLRADEPGYFRMPHVAQFVSAVTAACLVVQKEKFEKVGGLDESLAVAFNDVDLCLKLEAAGWKNVYVPHAVLLHHESKSRGSDMAPKQVHRYRAELEVLQKRWGTKTYNDPLHNPNLDRYSETFVLRV